MYKSKALKAHVATRRSGLILLSGHERHCLSLFAARVLHRLSSEGKPPPQVLPFPLDRVVPQTASEWESALARPLLRRYPGRPSEVLQRAAAHQPLILVLGQTPLQRHQLRSGEGDDRTAALVRFLGGNLPRLLAAAPPARPVQLLVMAEYESRGEQRLVTDLKEALAQADKGGLLTCVLEEPTTPTVDDLRRMLKRYRLRDSVIENLCESYARLLEDNDAPNLKKIIEILERAPAEELASAALTRDKDDAAPLPHRAPPGEEEPT